MQQKEDVNTENDILQ